MSAAQLVWNALEVMQDNGHSGSFVGKPARNETPARIRFLLRFCEELDVDMTIGELRDALDNYEPGFGDN